MQDIPYTSKKYNRFFHPNICHVCKSIQNTKSCKKCHMITYCSNEHKSLDKPKHKEICNAITKAIKEQPEQTSRYLNSQQWFGLQNSIVQFVEKNLERSLNKYELEIIMNAKSCLICHKQDTLRSCTICFSAYFCNDHVAEFYENHKPFCEGLLLHLNIYKKGIGEQLVTVLNVSRIPFSDVSSPDMWTYVYEYIKDEEDYYLTQKDYVLSEFASEPLTLYYGMKEAGLLSLLSLREETACVVHIIVTDLYNESNITGWKLLFHLLSNKTKLTIVIITHLRHGINILYKKCCDICFNYDRKLIYEFRATSYCSYVKSQEYKEPDVIMELSNQDTFWMSTDDIKALQLQFCPIIITSSLLSNLKSKIIQIENAIDTTIMTLLLKKNRFHSLIPHKTIALDTVYYRNMYVAIF